MALARGADASTAFSDFQPSGRRVCLRFSEACASGSKAQADVMLAFASHRVCKVMKPVVPGSILIVMTSSGTPPTVKTGDAEPKPAPVLFTSTP